MPEKSNPLTDKTRQHQARIVSGKKRSQIGYPTEAKDGFSTARYTNGDTVRTIDSEQSLTNSALTRETPAYLIPREGTSQIDAKQIESVGINTVQEVQSQGQVGGELTVCASIHFNFSDPNDEITLTFSSPSRGSFVVADGSTVNVQPGESITVQSEHGLTSGGIPTAFRAWISNYDPINESLDNPLTFTYPTDLDLDDIAVCPLELAPDSLGPI